MAQTARTSFPNTLRLLSARRARTASRSGSFSSTENSPQKPSSTAKISSREPVYCSSPKNISTRIASCPSERSALQILFPLESETLRSMLSPPANTTIRIDCSSLQREKFQNYPIIPIVAFCSLTQFRCKYKNKRAAFLPPSQPVEKAFSTSREKPAYRRLLFVFALARAARQPNSSPMSPRSLRLPS